MKMDLLVRRRIPLAALSDMLDGWRDGILTIGTFGFDPFKSSAEHNDYEAEDERYTGNNDDEEEVLDVDDHVYVDYEDEEMNPLMSSTFEHSLEDVDSNVKREVMMMVDGVAGSTGYENEMKFDLEYSEGHFGKLRRTTLAELFSEDLDIKKTSHVLWNWTQILAKSHLLFVPKMVVPLPRSSFLKLERIHVLSK